MTTKNLSILLCLTTFTTLFGGGKEIVPQQPVVQEIIIRESSENPIKKYIRYAIVVSGGALFIDAHYLNGRYLWNPLKRRLFPEMYNRLDQINTGVTENGQKLKTLSDQIGRVETGVTQNGEALTAVKSDTESLKTGQTELGTSLTETKNSITQMAATLTLVQTQGQETRTAVCRLEEGQQQLAKEQKQIATDIKTLLQQSTASAQRQGQLLTHFNIDTKNLSYVGMPGQS